MKIKGFTLAEVLIVITVLGIIAALTLPALNANIQKQQAGPALMRAMSTLETANALVSQEQDFYDFEESCHNYLRNCFEPFVKEKIGAAKFEEDIEYDHENGLGMVFGTEGSYITPNGFIYYVNGANYSNQNKSILISIDINGKKLPNKSGKDLFELQLFPDNEGSKLYAYGSIALHELDPRMPVWKDVCNERRVRNARACTGAIVDNNGRVIYPW